MKNETENKCTMTLEELFKTLEALKMYVSIKTESNCELLLTVRKNNYTMQCILEMNEMLNAQVYRFYNDVMDNSDNFKITYAKENAQTFNAHEVANDEMYAKKFVQRTIDKSFIPLNNFVFLQEFFKSSLDSAEIKGMFADATYSSHRLNESCKEHQKKYENMTKQEIENRCRTAIGIEEYDAKYKEVSRLVEREKELKESKEAMLVEDRRNAFERFLLPSKKEAVEKITGIASTSQDALEEHSAMAIQLKENMKCLHTQAKEFVTTALDEAPEYMHEALKEDAVMHKHYAHAEAPTDTDYVKKAVTDKASSNAVCIISSSSGAGRTFAQFMQNSLEATHAVIHVEDTSALDGIISAHNPILDVNNIAGIEQFETHERPSEYDLKKMYNATIDKLICKSDALSDGYYTNRNNSKRRKR